MAEVTGLTAQRMLDIEAASITSGEIVGDDLILIQHNGAEVNAGNVRGPIGPAGPSQEYAIVQHAGQTITNNVHTPVSFTEADIDDANNWHDPATNPSRIAPGAGIYQVSVFADWAANSVGRRAVSVQLNGTTFIGQDFRAMAGESVGTFSSFFDGLIIGATDYFEITAHQTSGADLILTTCRVTVTKKA